MSHSRRVCAIVLIPGCQSGTGERGGAGPKRGLQLDAVLTRAPPTSLPPHPKQMVLTEQTGWSTWEWAAGQGGAQGDPNKAENRRSCHTYSGGRVWTPGLHLLSYCQEALMVGL